MGKMERLWIDAVEFQNYGEWLPETQFVREVGTAYLLASKKPGVPVQDATTEFSVQEGGYYRFFVRTKNWKTPEAPGRFKLAVDEQELENECEKMPSPVWYWEIAGDMLLEPGIHKLSLIDKSGWLSRCSSIIITNDFNFTPSPEKERMLKQRAEMKGIDPQRVNTYDFDFVVVGAGPGGVPAAVSAARNGLKVALICGRPTVGGNASREGTVGLDGAGSRYPGMHETGIANEIKRVRESKGIVWHEAMEYLLAKEDNISVFCNCLCIDAICEKNVIREAVCIDTMTLEKSVFRGKMFADCSGDGWLGYYAGAAYRLGREAKHEYNEEFAPESPDTLSMSGCICRSDEEYPKLRSFYAIDTGNPVEFIGPEWAVKFPKEIYRNPTSYNMAPWWLENSNDFDDLWEAEYARDELIRIAVGYFDWLKNSYVDREKVQNFEMVRVALHNSKRENRRLIGDYVLSQNDFVEGRYFEDAIAYAGWSLDVHHVQGIYSGKGGEFHSNLRVPLTPIPYRCLYSVNIDNLFMASRCSSFTHLGLGSARVEATIATLGQAVGMAAAMCVQYHETPRGIYERHINTLQQNLIKDDQTILGVDNRDTADLARNATVTASSYATEINENEIGLKDYDDVAHPIRLAEWTVSSYVPALEGVVSNRPDNVINGRSRADAGSNNAWVSDFKEGLPASITLTLKKEVPISMVQITADTDLEMPRYAFHPVQVYDKTVKDLTVEVLHEGEWENVGEVQDNFMRQMRVHFDKISATAVRVTVTKTWGSTYAKINEIRIYE